MRTKHLDLRGCSYCDSYARHQCDAWNIDLHDFCGLTLCDFHVCRRGGLTFCAAHAGKKQESIDADTGHQSCLWGDASCTY